MYACAFVQILGKMHGFAEYAFARPGWAGGRARRKRKRQRVAALSLFSDDFHGDLLSGGSGGAFYNRAYRTGNASLSADYLAHVLRSHAHLDGAAGLGIHPADINLLGLGNKTGHNVSNQFLHEKKPRPCKQGLPFVRISARSFTMPNLQSVSRQDPTVSVSRSRRSS